MSKYIFTVTAGRSGQSTLYKVIKENFLDVYPTFEHPQVNTRFNGFLGNLERKFRRRFVETHELLGRGEVIKSFRDDKYEFIYSTAKKRIREIDYLLDKNNKKKYFDISKYFIRGLHIGFVKNLDSISLVLLVRDPVLNMRSFLNRNKYFYLDNDYPNSKSNILSMNEENLSKEELYFWSWFECYLRFVKLKDNEKVKKATIIETSCLNNKEYLKNKLKEIDLITNNISLENKLVSNTNVEQGYKETIVLKSDVEKFENFLKKIPKDLISQINYLKNYDPYKIHNF